MAETKVQFDDFNDFMAGKITEMEAIDYVASKRMKDKEGNAKVWKIKAISSKEDDAIRKSCMRNVKVPGRSNVVRPEMDSTLYMGRVAVACTVYPDLNNKTLQDHYGVMSGDELLKAMLLPGEYTDYINKISEINGFDIGNDELVEQAKN